MRVIRLVVIFALLGLAASTRAQPHGEPKLRVVWEAPPECPQAATAGAKLVQLLDSRALDAEPPELAVRVRRLPDGRFEAQIEVSGEAAAGERVLVGADCESLADAAVLIAALTVDRTGEAAPVAQTEALPAAPHTEARLAPSLGVRVAGDLGSLPGATLGLGLFSGLKWARWRGVVDAQVWLPRATARGPSGGYANVALYSASGRGCFDLTPGKAAVVAACLGAELGLSSGRGVTLPTTDRAHGLWAAALLGTAVRVLDRKPVFLEFSVDGLFAWRRPIYTISGEGTLFQASRFVARVGLNLGWTFR